MASCGEVDVSPGRSTPPAPECAICLQSCVHPVLLPCRHVFCFLCAKGASWHSKRCALCRQEVPKDFLERPTLLSPEELKAAAAGVRGGVGGGAVVGGDHAWYYEGRNGWWQYDERASRELEEAFATGRKSAEMLIAGFLYVADLENMVQYRRNEHGRRRRMKRDVVDVPKKGVAGLRLDPDPAPGTPLAADYLTRCSQVAGGLAGLVPVPPVRPPTVLGGHLVSPASPSPPSVEDSLSQLLISQPEGEEEEVETASSTSHAYDSASGSSEDEEDEEGPGWERGRAGAAGHRHRGPQWRLRYSQPERPPPGGGSSRGGPSTSSRSPDSQ